MENTENERFYLIRVFTRHGEELIYLTKIISNFNKIQFLDLKDLKDRKLCRVKVMEMNEEWQSVRVQYVVCCVEHQIRRRCSTYLSRIEEW